MASSQPLSERLHASLRRAVDIRNYACIEHDGKTVLRGNVKTRDEAFMCRVIAKMVPGVSNLVMEVQVDL